MSTNLTGLGAAAPAIAMIGFFACLIGGGMMVLHRRDTKKGVLLLIMAVVLLANVAIWTL
jgi:hypothetical protein